MNTKITYSLKKNKRDGGIVLKFHKKSFQQLKTYHPYTRSLVFRKLKNYFELSNRNLHFDYDQEGEFLTLQNKMPKCNLSFDTNFIVRSFERGLIMDMTPSGVDNFLKNLDLIDKHMGIMLGTQKESFDMSCTAGSIKDANGGYTFG